MPLRTRLHQPRNTRDEALATGQSLYDAVLESVTLRIRPIVLTATACRGKRNHDTTASPFIFLRPEKASAFPREIHLPDESDAVHDPVQK